MKITFNKFTIAVFFAGIWIHEIPANGFSCFLRPISLAERLAVADGLITGTIQRSVKLKSSVEGFQYMSKIKVEEQFSGVFTDKIVTVYWNPQQPHECDSSKTSLHALKNEGPGNLFLITLKKKGKIFFTNSELGSDVVKRGQIEEMRKLILK